MADVVSNIKAKVDHAAFDLTTAEGRAAFDNALRDELKKIEDSRVRAHAGEMLKEWRFQLFGLPVRPFTDPTIERLHRRLIEVENRLGIERQTEVESLRVGGDG